MVTFLKGRRRTDDSVVAVDSSGANVTAALEKLVARAESALTQLKELIPVMDRSDELETLRGRCVAVEEQMAGIQKLGEQMETAVAQAARVAEAQAEMDELQGRMNGMEDKIERVLKLREQLDHFLGQESAMEAVQSEHDAIRAQLAEFAEQVTRMRGQADDALTAHRHSTSRLDAFNEDSQAATGRLEEVERRVQAVSRALEPVDQAVTEVPELQHRLAVLKALADQVSQKTGMLEQQREAVDRAATQISQLTRLDRELDTWLRRQEEQIRRFGQIEAKISEVQATQGKVLARSDELQAISQQTEEAQQAARQALNDLREQMRKSSESFELDNRGLHAVSERIGDLRNAVKECEARFAVLDAASQGAAAVQAQVRSLNEQASALSGEIGRIGEEARRLGSFGSDVARIDATVGEVTSRIRRIEELRSGIEEAVKDLASLKGTRELMADGLEQMRLAYEEMERVREAHGETQAWLTNTDVWTRKVQGEVKELGAMQPAVERMRAEVDEVKGAMADIESRREVVDEVNRRLGDLSAVSGELEGRTDGLKGRMDAAETRFQQLAKQADEAELRFARSKAAPSSSTTWKSGSGCSARSWNSGKAPSTRPPSTWPRPLRSGRKRPRRRTVWRSLPPASPALLARPKSARRHSHRLPAISRPAALPSSRSRSSSRSSKRCWTSGNRLRARRPRGWSRLWPDRRPSRP
jgi:chromosome segregation ATPase